jgi:GNAT superfamily N-acetyltransferase
MRFDADWAETFELREGQQVRFRLVRPGDKELLQAGLHELSPESQYRRFFTAKPRLSDAELKYFTEVDGTDHFAIGGVLLEDGQETRGIAIARFVRLPGKPTVAEPAIVVLDAFQRCGVGRRLLELLIEAGKERGIESFRSEFLATNDAIENMLRVLSADRLVIERDGPVVTADFPLHDAEDAPASRYALMLKWLRFVAERLLRWRRV